VNRQNLIQTSALIALLLCILGVSVWALIWAFSHAPNQITLHGWIALGLGAVLSVALGGGLMALSFYSARRGFDDDAASPSDHDLTP
jgi:cation transporter-like permease